MFLSLSCSMSLFPESSAPNPMALPHAITSVAPGSLAAESLQLGLPRIQKEAQELGLRQWLQKWQYDPGGCVRRITESGFTWSTGRSRPAWIPEWNGEWEQSAVIEYLPNIRKALCSIPSTEWGRERDRREGRRGDGKRGGEK